MNLKLRNYIKYVTSHEIKSYTRLVKGIDWIYYNAIKMKKWKIKSFIIHHVQNF